MSRRRFLPAAMLLGAAVSLALPGQAAASKRMDVGIFDDASVFGSPQTAFPTMKSLNVEVVRMLLTWGGRDGVANKRPARPTDPADPAYEWGRYDRAIEGASQAGMKVLLTIVGTPAWANGGQGPQRAPSSATTLREFSYAAARRYSGSELESMLNGLFEADLAIKSNAAEPEAALTAWLGTYVLGMPAASGSRSVSG